MSANGNGGERGGAGAGAAATSSRSGGRAEGAEERGEPTRLELPQTGNRGRWDAGPNNITYC